MLILREYCVLLSSYLVTISTQYLDAAANRRSRRRVDRLVLQQATVVFCAYFVPYSYEKEALLYRCVYQVLSPRWYRLVSLMTLQGYPGSSGGHSEIILALLTPESVVTPYNPTSVCLHTHI